jgi:hypothetical protein
VPAPANSRFLVAFAPRNDKNFEINFILRQTWRPDYRQAAEMLPSFARRADECVRRYAINLLTRDHRQWNSARHYWALSIGGRGIHADHLSRFWWHQADAAGQQVNALGIPQRGVLQA